MVAVLYIGLSVLCALTGLYLSRRSISVAMLKKQHDVAGAIFSMIGVVYAVLMAFVVVVVWEQFEAAENIAEREANSIANIYRLSWGLPPNIGVQMRGDVESYVNVVLEREWPAMEGRKAVPEAEQGLEQIWKTVMAYEPRAPKENAIYGELLPRLADLGNARRLRLLASRQCVPILMWILLIFGGIATVAFTYLFGVENLKMQTVMVTVLTILVSLVMFLIFEINRPFSGDLKVGPDAFMQVKRVIDMVKTPGS
jgi:hypothetical protein